jgi:RNA polymerase subunit RPABC4/transcription elongation factor Spt4
MKLFLHEGTCPYCHSPIQLGKLRKVPFSGALKWHQFTPRPRQACPHCGGLVRNSMLDSQWLYLPFAMVLVLVGSLLAGVKLPWLAQLAVMLLAIAGVHMALRSGRFETDE